MNHTSVPNCIIHLFAKGSNLPTKKSGKKSEGEYIFLGVFPQSVFETLPWKSKILDEEHPPGYPNHRYAYIRTSEAVLYALGESQEEGLLSDIQKLEVLEYAEKAGIEIPQSFFEGAPSSSEQPKKKSGRKKEEVKSSQPVEEQNDPRDLYHGKIYAVKEIILESSLEVKTPSGSRSLDLLPGKHKFALIDSSLEHEKGSVQWLALYDQLPVVYGKSVSTWQMLLDHDPLAE